jgi:NADH-quinone oxidoreductase subunit N
MEAPLIVAIVFLIAGFGFKVAVVPFHMWAPDVYQGAPTTISTFLAAGSKKVGIVALFKVFLIGLLAIQVDWIAAIAVIAIVTQTVGNLFAIPQRNIKRMLAYSSIAQVGYILIAIPVGALAIYGNAPGATGDSARAIAVGGLVGGMYHVLTHAIMKGGAFLVVAATATAGIGEEIGDYKGLGKRMPFVAWSMMFFMFSLAGIPTGGGFVSKFLLFSSAVSAMAFNPWFLALAVSGVLNSAVSLYYYARVVWYMMILDPPEGAKPATVGRPLMAAIALALVLIILTLLVAFPFIEYIQGAARTFFGF